MKFFYLLPLLLLSPYWSYAQPTCAEGESSVIITVQTDQYGYEVSWEVRGIDGTVYGTVDVNTYANNAYYETQVCVPAGECTTFTINDTYGDGLITQQGGFYTLAVDEDTIMVGGNYRFAESTQFNCLPGQACTSAEAVVEDTTYVTTFDDHWYVFKPDSVGIYEVSTCGMNDCATKIWIYDTCEGNGQAEDNSGIIFYDDGQGGCDSSAVVTGVFNPELVYLIRIGDYEDACANDSIGWSITYRGPVVGCMDPSSCNYNPIATVDDGSCLPQGDPNCPDGPDLLVRQDELVSSIYVSQVEADDECLILEGCLQGYGTRDVLRFDTYIENIGETDYYIGEPSFDNDQFTWDNCHNHFHYDGYAEYLMFAEDGTKIPIGYKNGFCVIDLGCTTGSAQFSCGNMGISAGCYDEYWAELECQWIDVTDIPDGNYVFVTRVNWDNAPDALGQVEKDTLNNWAQACIALDRSSGQLQVSVSNDCPTYTDCNGTLYGNVVADCSGECGGTRLMGDLDANGLQQMIDAESYVTRMLGNDIVPTSCNDLNADDKITVYDASLLASCINYGKNHIHTGEGSHDHCNFPGGRLNINDTTTLSILDIDFDAQFIDIGIRNPSALINAYQFRVEGVNIMSVENLVDEASFPINPYNNIVEGMVVGISYQDSMIVRSDVTQPLCRIHFNMITTEDFICIKEVIDVVNQNIEQTITVLEDECFAVVIDAVEQPLNASRIKVMPNPFRSQTQIFFNNPDLSPHNLEILDWNGKVVRSYAGFRDNSIIVERGQLPTGIYVYRLSNRHGAVHGKLSIQ
ncbi:MAG: lysyl oxidase family protein [Bacteroidota bacterium]